MDIVNNRGEKIGISVIKADKKGGVFREFLKPDGFSKLGLNIIELMEQGVCPECGGRLYDGFGTNGERFTACKKCEFFTE